MGEEARLRALPPDALSPGEAVEQQQSFTLEPAPRSAGEARSLIRKHLPAVGDEIQDTVLLLTSELVTNAVIHARTSIDVGMAVTKEHVVVAVFDLDLGRRELPTPEVRDGGRGLMLVEALADAWSVHRPPGGGKTVWFRVARDSAAHTNASSNGGASQ
jgi:anti-sigma regulatory factor (Ser/Thr protein kinase)